MSATAKGTQAQSEAKKTTVELLCPDFPRDNRIKIDPRIYLQTALESCKGLEVADFVIESSARNEHGAKIEIICPSRHQAHKVADAINRTSQMKTQLHRIRARIKIRRSPKKIPTSSKYCSEASKVKPATTDSEVGSGLTGNTRPTKSWQHSSATVSSKQMMENEAMKKLSTTVKELRRESTAKQTVNESVETAVDLICHDFPEGSQEEVFLETTLGDSFNSIKLTDIVIGNVSRKENDTTIEIICPSRVKARKLVSEINKKSHVHKITAVMDQPRTSGNVSDKDLNNNAAPSTSVKDSESCANQSPRATLFREKTDCFRKMATISSPALQIHQARIDEAKEIVNNFEKLKGTFLEYNDEMMTTKKVHLQKLEELQRQKIEYEKYWTDLVVQVNDEKCEYSRKNFESLVDLCRVEARKLKSALPIYGYKSDIIQSVLQNDYVVLLGETGSGKSTQTPQYLSQTDLSKRGLIACIQPRQVAAVSLAEQVAKEMGTYIGGSVGYKAGYRVKKGPDTKVVYTTNHSMLKEIIQDPVLTDYSCLIVDEAHERSIYCDLLLGMIKEAKINRPDLKVIVMSATIDPKLFVNYFDDCPVVKVSGRTFPVEVVYDNDNEFANDEKYLQAAITKAKEVHRTEPQGDILVFLTSPAEIEKAVAQTEQDHHVLSLPLHGRLQPDQQRRVFNPSPPGLRKIVFATNAAETSITIPGIKYVIDTGKAKEMSFDSTKGISSLDVQWISRSSADQRKGRAGRIESGKCFRLYPENTYTSMTAGSVPEILRSSTEMAFLTLMTLGIRDPTEFDFVEAPPKAVMQHAMNELREIGAVSPEGGLTELGNKLAKLNVEPKYGKLLLETIEQGFGFDGLVVTALLTVGSSIFFRMGSPSEKQLADKLKARFCSLKGDIYTMYDVFKEWYSIPKNMRTTWCSGNSINAKSMRMCLDFVNDLNTTLKKELDLTVEPALSDVDFSEKLDHLLLQCYKKNLCCFTGHSKVGYYVPQLQSAIVLHPSSALQMLKHEPQWIVFTTVLETNKKYLLHPCVINPALVEKVVGLSMMEVIKCQMQVWNLDLELVYSESLGPTAVRRFIGAKGQNIQGIENYIRTDCFVDEFAFDVSVASCKLNFFCSPDIADPAVEHIKSAVTSLKGELIGETIEERLHPNSDVFYVLEEGAMLKTVLMTEEYRTIIIRQSPHMVSDARILDLFGRFGKIQKHFVFRQEAGPGRKTQNGWGGIMYENESDAKQVMQRYNERSDVELCHFLLEPQKRHSPMSNSLATNLSVSWPRRLCTGLGFICFDDYQTCSEAYEALHSIDMEGMTVVHSRKNNNELVLRNVSRLMTEEKANSIVDRAVQGINYKIRLVRQRSLAPGEAEVDDIKDILVSKIRDESLETNFKLDLLQPKEKDFTWKGFIKTPNADIAEKIHSICQRSIHMGDVPVQFDLKLSGQIPVNLRLFQRLRRQYEVFIFEAREKYRPAEVSLEQNRFNKYFVKVSAPDATSYREIGLMFNDLIFGSLVDVPNEFDMTILESQDGRKFLVSLGQEFHCVVEVDKRNRGVRVYANQRVKDEVTGRIVQFMEKNRDRVCRSLELFGEDKPNGLMKYLITIYGVDLQLFIFKTSVDSAEVNLRQHVLMITGKSEAIGKAVTEVENAAKALFEKPQEENPAFVEDCPICLCPITEKIYYTERCGHPYCDSCFKAMFISAGRNKEVPIVCAKENCGEKIVIKDISNLFGMKDEGYQILLDAALEQYVSLNKQKVRYCLTPDCNMLYKATSSRKTFQCPSCFVKICQHCHSPGHEGLSCNMFKIINSKEDRGVADWLKEDRKDRCLCPKCNALIEKAGGCNHMTCHMCKGHFCWICKKPFQTSGQVYAHLSSTHGGNGLPDIIPDDLDF